MRLPLPQFSSDRRHPDHIAEVIETATTGFLAQCLEPEDLNFPLMPPFGSWVKAIDEESGNKIYGIVTHVTTSPIDSVHRARALGLSLADLREQQPQIFAMLKTEFRTALVGFESPPPVNTQLRSNKLSVESDAETRGGGDTEKIIASLTATPHKNGKGHLQGKVYQYLPPRPPQIHQAVYHCEAAEVIHFSERLDFLRILLQVEETPVEALAAAAIREIYRLRQGDRDWLVKVGRQLSLLLKDDYDRLRYILSQIHD